jgi:hypothetical protein
MSTALQLQKRMRAKCSTTAFPSMFTCRELWLQIPPVPDNYCVMYHPTLRTVDLFPGLNLYIINSLDVGGAVVCLHQDTQPTLPQISAFFSSGFCLFSISCHSQLAFYDKLAQVTRPLLRTGKRNHLHPSFPLSHNWLGVWRHFQSIAITFFKDISSETHSLKLLLDHFYTLI